MDKKSKQKSGLSESFIMGVIAIVFLIVGYQTALFIHNAAITKIVADRDQPDTVYVYPQTSEAVRSNSPHSPRAENVRANAPRKTVENFSFNPNTASLDDLCRLGFSQKQAQSIFARFVAGLQSSHHGAAYFISFSHNQHSFVF